MLNAISRVGKFSLLRVLGLWVVLWVGIYLTIVIINWGGALDVMRTTQIRMEITAAISANPAFQDLTPSERLELIEDTIAVEERRQGLDQPFVVRSGRYLINAMTLNLGRAEMLISDRGSSQVRDILTERLPPTLLLIATAELFLFFFCIFFALFLSRRYGGFLDRLTIALAPTSAAPAWFYGIFLILIFAAVLGVLPWGRMVDAPPPKEPLAYALSVLKHMVLPISAMVIGAIFSTIYSWRTFFLIYSSEDYVELAKAKGLSSRGIERRYILRPTLPPIITNFLLMLITMWMGAIILETVFNWPGLGRLLYQAIGMNDTPVIVGSVVIYGYLLAASVFLLDFIYAALDPRVRLGGGASGG
jgi:peptide/nickel transport system permease protein